MKRLLGMWVWFAAAACSPSHNAPYDGGIGSYPPDAGLPDGSPVDASVPGILGLSTGALSEHLVLGHSTHVATERIDVAAEPGTTWAATASASWIHLTSSATTGDGHVLVEVDAANPGVQLGANTGTILVANTRDPSNAIPVTVTLEVDLPTLTATPSPIVLGGDDGLDATGGASVDVSLDTGSNTWPWTATPVTSDGAPWLQLSEAAGQLSASPHGLTIHGDRGSLIPGRYHGTIQISAVVAGQTVEATIEVALNKQGDWLTATAAGVALSSFPGRKTLTRTVVITSSQASGATLTATTDQPWLSVELSSNHPGASITLKANPAGLAVDRGYIADVAIHAATGKADNTEHIRVGLWVGSRAPVASFATPSGGHHVIANPVEPWVYVSNDATRVYAYHVYTGGLVKTFVLPATRTGGLAISGDGRHLFVNDDGTKQILDVDAATGAVLHSYPSVAGASLIYVRPASQPMLFASNGTIHDLTTGATYMTGVLAGALAADSLGHTVYAQDLGLSLSNLRAFSLSYSALRDEPLAIAPQATAPAGTNGQDACATGDGVVYSAASSPSAIQVHDPDLTESPAFATTLPLDAIACGWNGLIVGGAAAAATTTNLWAYRPDGTLVSAFALHARTVNNIVSRTLALSGDNTRLIALMAASPPDASSFNIVDAPSP